LLAQGSKQEGGRLAYFGKTEDAKVYFETQLEISCPEYSNPADVYIEKLGVDSEDQAASEERIKVSKK
jgi:hypothetical protein